MSAQGTATRKVIAPVTHTRPRPPRQAAIQYLPHRCTTIAKKNSSTLHRWMLLKKCPTPVSCHQAGPFRARMQPEPMITISEAMLATPNT